MRASSIFLACAIVCAGMGCDGETDPGTDAGPAEDAGPLELCPTENVPAPEELMGPCCWRDDNSTQQDAPEFRLNYLELTEPADSPLSSITLRRVLNEAMQDESFSWLFRTDGASADGDVTITTGYGTRQADGTYAFSQGAADGDPDTWCPVEIAATLAGETVNSGPIDGAITIPIFDDTGTMLQIELTLRNLSIQDATWTEERACVGFKTPRPFTYEPDAQLTAFIEVEPSRTQMISVPPVETTVCSAIAGALDDATYCDTVDQSEWISPPDSLCDMTGCTRNADGMTDVCDPTIAGPGGCNAWRIVGQFAAAGVDITNGACP